MKKVAPPKSNILVQLYRKPKWISFFDKYYIAPRGYSLVVVEQGETVRTLPRIGGKVNGSNALYLMKISFDMTWGVSNLTCVLENNVTVNEFGFNGSVSFEVKSAENFFDKLNVVNIRKMRIDDFKDYWLKHWGDLLKRTFSSNSISYRQAPQLIDALKYTIDKEIFATYGVNVLQVSISDTNRVSQED